MPGNLQDLASPSSTATFDLSGRNPLAPGSASDTTGLAQELDDPNQTVASVAVLGITRGSADEPQNPVLLTAPEGTSSSLSQR